MARKSRKPQALTVDTTTAVMDMAPMYNAAVYVRLSVEDNNLDSGDSIEGQKEMLTSFVEEQEDMALYAVYCDNGFTDSNFDRDDFCRMMDNIKDGKVNCIASLGIDMAMKNIVYDLYSRDLSVKVRSARKSLMKKGDYIAPFAIYGYTNKAEKKRLVIDPLAAEVVKRIFEYAANGEKARNIAIRLNSDGVLTPNEHNKSKSTKKKHYVELDATPIWTADIIRRIVQDERYTGKMVCGKYTTIKRKTILIPKEDWVITPNTHEAIVSEEVFGKAQAIFRTRTEIVMPDKPKSILTGMLKCAHCNKNLVFESRYRRAFYCHNFNMGLGCEQAKVDEQVLIDTIFTVIKTKLALVEAAQQTVVSEQQARADKRESDMRELATKLKKLKLAQTTTLEQFLEGKLSKDKYQSQKIQIASDIQEATGQLATLDIQSENASELIENHRPFFGQETLTREMVQALIKEVRVTSPDEIEIVWKFQDCYNDLQPAFMP